MSRVFRTIVRGRFSELSGVVRSYLLDHVDEHDPSHARFAAEPNFPFTHSLDTFEIRLELRTELAGDDGISDIDRRARDEAGLFLRVLGVGHRDVRVAVTEMTG